LRIEEKNKETTIGKERENKTTKKDVSFLGYNAMWTCRWVPTFRRNILPPSSVQNKEALFPLETLVSLSTQSPHGVTTQKTNTDSSMP
jgi:hypothetical protein